MGDTQWYSRQPAHEARPEAHVAKDELCQQRGRSVVLPVMDSELMSCRAKIKAVRGPNEYACWRYESHIGQGRTIR
ncbi:hypothetical protein IG631_02258 [Alternaria alternata]|nr:hypothetical protein IG631_02258 [Alternaria alternata]